MASFLLGLPFLAVMSSEEVTGDRTLGLFTMLGNAVVAVFGCFTKEIKLAAGILTTAFGVVSSSINFYRSLKFVSVFVC